MNKYFKFIIFMISTSFVLIGCSGKGAPASAGGGVWFNHDRRTTGTLVDDQAITIKANLAIAKDKELWQKSHISTLSYNNTLLLVGQVPSEYYKKRIEELIKPIPEVETVYNQVSVENPITLSLRTKDTWITTQVKAKLLSSHDIGPNRVKVITEEGIVYLMGILTKDEEAIAVDIARRISGVNQVVKVFERFEQKDSIN